MKYPKVYAITLSYNRPKETVECIRSLQKMVYPNCEILVVENGSTDDSAEILGKAFPEINLFALKKNVGYSRGFNIGLKWGYMRGAEYFLILNNDTVIDADALSELIRAAESDKVIGFVSGKVYFYNDCSKLQTVGKADDPLYLAGKHIGYGEYDLGQYDEERELNFIDDVFLLVRRSVYEKIGGYDERFFMHWEETDWCARARRAGFRILYTPKAKIWHKGLLTTSDGMSAEAFYYLTRNQILFMWRNAGENRFRAFTSKLLLMTFPRNIFGFLKHREFVYFKKYIQGILSGYLWVLRDGRSDLAESHASEGISLKENRDPNL
jgi:GT2 family glycosyltransferase